jgi:diguanylate cyclase (GGDEF)-like protein/PAS domain S-box-containing protein
MAVSMAKRKSASGPRLHKPPRAASGSAISLDHLGDTLRSLIGSSSNPIFSVNAECSYTSFNASYAAVMKALYGADIELGKCSLGYQSEADRVVAQANFDRALRGESFVEESYFGDEERSRRFFEVAYDPIRDAVGAVVGVAVHARDVSARKAMETALRQSEERYRHLFENMQEGCAYCRMLFDAAGRPLDWVYLAVNPAFERLTGLHDIVGKRILEVLPQTRDENPELLEIYGRVVVSGQAEEFEIDFKPLGLWLRVSAFRPEPEHFVAVFEDVTERRLVEADLAETAANLGELLDASPAAIIAVDAAGNVMHWNPAAEHIFGWTAAEVLGQQLPTVTPETEADLHARVNAIFAGRTTEPREVVRRRKDGSLVELNLWNAPLRDAAGGVKGVIGLFIDLSDIKQARRTLRRSEGRLGTLLEQAPVGVLVFDKDLVITECNEHLTEMVGSPREEVIGFALTPTLDQPLRRSMMAALNGSQESYEGLYHATLSDRDVWISARAAPLLADDGSIEGGMVVIADLTDYKKATDLVEKLAFYDVLTGLPNHTLFRDRLRQAIAVARRSGRPLAVAALNIDRFKHIADSLGHQMAERFLQQLAEGLAQAVHDRDTLSRSGPNDFLVLLPELRNSRDANRVAQRLLTAARGPWEVGGHTFRASVSAGVALFPSDGPEAEDLLQRAEWALRRANEAGPGSCQFFDESMSADAREHLGLETQLHRALEEGQFVVYYQPQVDLRSFEIVGAEALVRWAHPERGLVAPLEFIPLAEESGLIAALDRLVLDAACAYIGSFMVSSGRRLRLAVNLSARELGSANLAKSVAQILKDRDFPPGLLEIEVTETAAMAQRDIASVAVAALKSLGVTVALDDFGTGYSSLSHLQGLAVQRLKIDRAFIKDLPGNADSAAIASAVISLAHSLGIGVLAEGIETAEQLEFLRERGCDEAQGFLFGRPMPAEAWGTFLAKWSWPAQANEHR